ncbi:hypothetical protein DFH08DRAFT_843807 [Mycena albidolilacea]|uniref:Uncharacterized protein n=1 Tax=Mycena albidolilacea TaxID=1033008 RepID=A0AAD7AKH6_9AGAR|nr:hypothetical protein DFH08DRAFT_843807 [Mycena albidolilacea]
MSGFAPETGQGASLNHRNDVYQSVFSQHPPVNVPPPAPQHLPETVSAGPPRECSVRGCSNTVEPSANPLTSKKMCASCREKHRGYASTKRARRKAEKTLVSKLSVPASADAQDTESASWMNQDSPVPVPPVPYTSESSQATPQPAPVPWAIDPVLYAQPPAPPSSSTLAGALTLPPSALTLQPSPNTQNSNAQNHQPSVPVLPSPSDSASVTPEPTTTSGAIQTPTTSEAIHQTSDDRPRHCSVKGCKAMIVESLEVYPYKMCQSCRNRYRSYGVTKRAKWKAERETFQRELDGLRAKEDARRVSVGLHPFYEGSDELRAWELSIIDEEVPRPNGQTHEAGDTSTPEDPLTATPEPTNRTCTVSHCHNLLSASYPFKRCEAHRIQNRWHSKLKRGREKIEKGFMLPDGTPLVTPGPIKRKTKDPMERKTAPKRKDKDVQNSEEDAPAKFIPRRSRSAYSCREDNCCNLILPSARWRSCEPCRDISKASRQEKKAAERAHTFVNMTVDAGNPAAGPSISTGGPSSEPSTADVSSDDHESTGPSESATSAPATYPPGYTSTSTLLTVNEPPPQTVPTGRTVRKYRRWPRYDKDGNPIIDTASRTPKSADSSTAPSASTPIPAAAPVPAVAPIPAVAPSTSTYPYPPPPNPYYYMPPGYYGMPPPPPGSASGQPPMMWIPYPMPPSDKPGAAPGPPAYPYPYYPYPIPGYGLPQHPPGTRYTYTPAATVPPVPAAVYRPYQPSTSTGPPPHLPSSLPAASISSQGFSYQRYRVDLKNPAPPPEAPEVCASC